MRFCLTTDHNDNTLSQEVICSYHVNLTVYLSCYTANMQRAANAVLILHNQQQDSIRTRDGANAPFHIWMTRV